LDFGGSPSRGRWTLAALGRRRQSVAPVDSIPAFPDRTELLLDQLQNAGRLLADRRRGILL
jgi:hypothetical protein